MHTAAPTAYEIVSCTLVLIAWGCGAACRACMHSTLCGRLSCKPNSELATASAAPTVKPKDGWLAWLRKTGKWWFGGCVVVGMAAFYVYLLATSHVGRRSRGDGDLISRRSRWNVLRKKKVY